MAEPFSYISYMYTSNSGMQERDISDILEAMKIEDKEKKGRKKSERWRNKLDLKQRIVAGGSSQQQDSYLDLSIITADTSMLP